MSDIIMESFGAVFAGIILWVLTYNMGVKSALQLPGSKYILTGFCLLFFGMLIDITDNFPQLNHLVVIGDTEIEAFLEKVVGTLFGLLFVAIGFYLWLPSVIKLEQTEKELKSLNAQLDMRVQKRTKQLENINERLRYEYDKRKISEKKLRKQALFDGLTGLPNRILMLERLTQLIDEAKRKNNKVAVLFLDIDYFKKVNDTLGHKAGDDILRQAAGRISAEVRSYDTVARLGGDEFVVILGGISEASTVSMIAEKLVSQFRIPYIIDNRELTLTVSIGASMFPDDGELGTTLLCNSDSAMYQSKEAGRNTYSYFTDKMNAEMSRRLNLENEIHGALERNEFTVYYQPKINISTNKFTGTEALLRWCNPVLGNVSPAEFIPIAEQNSLIVQLGEFVLNEAMRDTAEWQQKYDPDLTVAVNLSPRQFRDPNLIDYIENTVKKHFSSGSCLELEITEGVLMGGQYIEDALKRLSELGVNIAMDDFGTGYSSLSYLRKFPFNVLKIDKSFVDDITTSPSDQTLIKAAVAMAHGLNLKVIAEGVETEKQLEYLEKLDCDYAQGYFFSKPIPFDKMDNYLASYSSTCPRNFVLYEVSNG
ncbi:putative bifunctional diguanylate cyclase/phosphodiesterase [Psychromonas aquimarina]|uniref:putative bifunctional diguanylate cyclase/phosphodiesterase n=1 Tax=Psychromonas aquimarina TaxID=444919 RepID=UPI00041B7E5D|nr:EAL domain-containing protein [Psychromonas aquimarina]